MVAFLASLPKSVIAIGVILMGFIVIVLGDPPHTVCDSQLDLFREQQQEFLYSRKGTSGAAKPALVKELFALCQSGNSPGGCFEFFVRLKKMNQDLGNIPRQCADTAADDAALKTWILNSMKLMTQIAWGDHGPTSLMRRSGWFDTSDLSVFCDMKKHAMRFYGQASFEKWRTDVLDALPESQKAEPDQLIQKSLFGTPCDSYR